MHVAQPIETSRNIPLRKSSYKALKQINNENPLNITFSFLDINSIRYKNNDLKFLYTDNAEILLIGEVKIDPLFPDAHFSY